MFEDLTLLTCSYNTPQHLHTMLQSFVHIHGDGPFNLIVMENSTNDKTQKILDNNNIKYIKNPGGTHSESVDNLISVCNTKYALLIDSDIVFTQKIDKLLEVMKTHNGTIMGEIQASRGGYNLYPRIAPWFCFINIDDIKKHKIRFHDQARIDRTNSGYFYKSVPLNPHVNNTSPFYDTGATFYEDINRARLNIIEAKGIIKYFKHYEGGSWRRVSGHEGYINLGNQIYRQFLSDTKHLEATSIKGKFNVI